MTHITHIIIVVLSILNGLLYFHRETHNWKSYGQWGLRAISMFLWAIIYIQISFINRPVNHGQMIRMIILWSLAVAFIDNTTAFYTFYKRRRENGNHDS